jgi:hypothetical protein
MSIHFWGTYELKKRIAKNRREREGRVRKHKM